MIEPIRAWAEEPIRSNPYLTQLDESSGELVLDDSTRLQAYRYGFAAEGATKEVRQALGRAVVEFAGLPAALIWSLDTHYLSPARLRYTRAQRERDGWTLAEVGNLLLGKKEATEWPPTDAMGDGGSFVALGSLPAALDIANSAMRPTLGILGRSSKLHPSRQFIDYIVARRCWVTYWVGFDPDTFALVVIASDRITFPFSVPDVPVELVDGPRAALRRG